MTRRDMLCDYVSSLCNSASVLAEEPSPCFRENEPFLDPSSARTRFKISRFGSPERRLPPVLAPLRGPGQQSQRHGATQTTPWSTSPMTQRHPDDALVTNPNDTAQPTPQLCQQSPRHSAAQTTPCSAIPMTQRHPDDALVSNPNDTAPTP